MLFQDAMKCFWKAHCVGDIEGGIALFQLAKLYEKTGDTEQAASAYHQYIMDTEAQGQERDQQSKAFKFLAQFFLKKGTTSHSHDLIWQSWLIFNNVNCSFLGQLEDAYDYAQKCTEFTDTREEGKAFLKEISSKSWYAAMPTKYYHAIESKRIATRVA